MKLSKFLSLVMLVTCLSLAYVWQQTEAFRLAYLGQKRQSVFEDLLDKNSILRYNIKKNASLVRIGSKVLNVADYQIPDTYQLVRLNGQQQGFKLKTQLRNTGSFVSRIFSVKRQAEAKTLNP